MRVLVLSQYYFPDPIPKPSDVAEALRRSGHEVSVVAGLPNYPSGRLADGYRLVPFRNERVNGVPVLRVFELPYHGSSRAGRLANYGSFLLSAILATLVSRPPDVVYAWHPPLTTGVVAEVLEKVRRVPFVYDVQDIWPDAAILSGMLSEGRLAQVMRRLERTVYRSASRILVGTESARENLVGKGVPAAKLTVLPNWVSPQSLAEPTAAEIERARNELGGRDRFVVTFAGNIGFVQGLDTLLDAAALATSEHGIVFRIVGDGSDRPRLERIARERQLQNVSFIGRRPPAQMPALLAASDALLVHLRPGPQAEVVVPTKTLAYMAAGRAVIMGVGGAAADVVRTSRAGIVVPPGDAKAIRDACVALRDLSADERRAMGGRGRDFVSRHFAADQIIPRLEELLVSAARERSHG